MPAAPGRTGSTRDASKAEEQTTVTRTSAKYTASQQEHEKVINISDDSKSRDASNSWAFTKIHTKIIKCHVIRHEIK
jgi:hypothetical protein